MGVDVVNIKAVLNQEIAQQEFEAFHLIIGYHIASNPAHSNGVRVLAFAVGSDLIDGPPELDQSLWPCNDKMVSNICPATLFDVDIS
jgi:hypothetical protein